MQKLSALTKEVLISRYVNEKLSLEDIGKIYGVSRVAIYKKLKKYGIGQRSKSEARIEAQKQRKLPQEFFDINESFFSGWSSEMAYVLGLVITDGCVSKSGAVSLCINDKELLEKVREIMGSTHKITLSKNQENLSCFRFAREKIIVDLERLGVVPRKSLIVKFPAVPYDYLPDFIRGVFDGDGSVYFEKRSLKSPVRSKFVSGSADFIAGLQKNLEMLGMPGRTIYKQKTKNGWNYSVVFGHEDSAKLFAILYKNNPKGLFLERKYKRFLRGFQGCLEGGINGERA